MMRGRIFLGWMVALAAVLVTTSGCTDEGSGKPTARLQGTVTLNGQPIPENASASITFRPTGTAQANSVSDEIVNGAYDVPDAPMGDVLVVFTITQPTGRFESFDGVGRPEEVIDILVPSDKAGGIAIQVDGDKSDLDFDL